MERRSLSHSDLFVRTCLEVAPRLLGWRIVHELATGGRLVARIVEVEAYLGDGRDPASHSRSGQTLRNAAMFGPPAHFYVYRSMGLHACANLVCERAGVGAAVLLRGAEPLEGIDEMESRRGGRTGHELASGPGRLTQALGIALAHDARPALSGALRIEPPRPRERFEIRASPRIGITRAADLPYRYFVADCPHVTRAPQNARSRPFPAGKARLPARSCEA